MYIKALNTHQWFKFVSVLWVLWFDVTVLILSEFL